MTAQDKYAASLDGIIKDLKIALARAIIVSEELRQRLEFKHPVRLPDNLDLQLREEIAKWAQILHPTE